MPRLLAGHWPGTLGLKDGKRSVYNSTSCTGGDGQGEGAANGTPGHASTELRGLRKHCNVSVHVIPLLQPSSIVYGETGYGPPHYTSTVDVSTGKVLVGVDVSSSG